MFEESEEMEIKIKIRWGLKYKYIIQLLLYNEPFLNLEA